MKKKNSKRAKTREERLQEALARPGVYDIIAVHNNWQEQVHRSDMHPIPNRSNKTATKTRAKTREERLQEALARPGIYDIIAIHNNWREQVRRSEHSHRAATKTHSAKNKVWID